jgi:hypothetical protein
LPAPAYHNGLVAGMIGVGTLLLAAIWVVVALKEQGVASFVGVLALGFLLLVSLVATTVLAAGATYITLFMSEAPLHATSFLLSFLIVSLLFAMMFKWLPDTDVKRRRCCNVRRLWHVSLHPRSVPAIAGASGGPVSIGHHRMLMRTPRPQGISIEKGERRRRSEAEAAHLDTLLDCASRNVSGQRPDRNLYRQTIGSSHPW